LTWKIIEKDGKLIAVRDRNKFPEESHFLERAGVPNAFRTRDFGNFRVDSKHPSLLRAKNSVLRYSEEYPAVDGGLLIMGPSGTGKTHLAVALCKKLMAKKRTDCFFVDFRESLREYSYLQTQEKREEFLGFLSIVELLIIDDFASRNLTEWEDDFVFRLINRRYGDGLPLVLTTVFKGKELEEKIGVRMRSRLYEMCREINIEAVDYRSKVRRASFRAGKGGKDEGED